MKKYKVTVLPGDGVGPELIEATIPIIRAINKRFGIAMDLNMGTAGLNAIEVYGTNLPDETVSLLKRSDCVIKGPMTTPEKPGSDVSVAVKIRKMFDLYANLRPARALPGVQNLRQATDLVIVRENTEGMYSGMDFMASKDTAMAIRVITREGSRRIGKFAFELAMKRRKHLTIVHKGNILKVSDGLFKETIYRLGSGYRKVTVDDAHADAMAQWLIKNPEKYDVIVTENMFGDILSDESSMLVGGVGMCPSANIGEGFAMFEPVHGSAPKYSGMGIANPMATILSIRMMYEWMGKNSAALSLQQEVEKALMKGVMTRDIGGKSSLSEVAESIEAGINRPGRR